MPGYWFHPYRSKGVDFIEQITAELEEAESDIRMARRLNEARDPKGAREAMTSAQLRINYADGLSRTAEAEARVHEREQEAA